MADRTAWRCLRKTYEPGRRTSRPKRHPGPTFRKAFRKAFRNRSEPVLEIAQEIACIFPLALFSIVIAPGKEKLLNVPGVAWRLPMQ
jgi:hypothetical protein